MNRHSNLTIFRTLLPPDPPRRAFRDPGQLLGWLHMPGADPEARNTVLHGLLRSAGHDAVDRQLATELLILALWPGLCVIRQGLRPLCEMPVLDADLLAGLSVGIGKADPACVRRVAATLLRNLERDLRRQYIRDDNVARCSVEMEMVKQDLTQPEVDRPEQILSAAQAALGDDGVLLTAVHIAGFSQKEAAHRLGISHAAARKRCQRAMARLQKSSDA